MDAEVVDEAGHDAGEAEVVRDGSILVAVFRDADAKMWTVSTAAVLA